LTEDTVSFRRTAQVCLLESEDEDKYSFIVGAGEIQRREKLS